ncbi:unnamed protein product [Zymoseptoria tritici ST99CH_3D1]|nr:unnamed protein product [Zymoseptoria tritici ST99CH_3D1]
MKSSTDGQAGLQAYTTTQEQRNRAAFFVGICASDPTFIELYPNYCQDSAVLQGDAASTPDAKIKTVVNTTRTCRLPPSTYGWLDPCASPYRMPIYMLPRAVEAIIACVNSSSTALEGRRTLD